MGAVLTVLGVLWIILKVILYILLYALIIVLLLTLLAVFVPFGYRIHAGYDGGPAVKAYLFWLFRLIGVQLTYSGGDTLIKVKVLSLTAYTYNPNRTKRGPRDKPEGVTADTAEAEKPAQTEDKPPPTPEAPVRAEKRTESTGGGLDRKRFARGIIGRLPLRPRRKAGKVAGPGRKARGMAIRIDDIKYLLVQGMRIVRAYLRALKPKWVRLRGVVGFEDPSKTGYAVGAAAAVSGILGWDVIVSGDFENAVIKGFIEVSGGIMVFSFILPLLRLLFQKRARRLVLGMIFKKGPANKQAKIQ